MVKLLKNYSIHSSGFFIPEGSIISDVVEVRDRCKIKYKGKYNSFYGTKIVKVPKEICVEI